MANLRERGWLLFADNLLLKIRCSNMALAVQELIFEFEKPVTNNQRPATIFISLPM
jgi:hypothetical protein